jgi:glucose-1-phosphate thymidylyltransferase
VQGILLSGGLGSRLWPTTRGTSKQLLPVYDKPLIYYPLSTLLLSGVTKVVIVVTAQTQESYFRLLGDGNEFGVTFDYAIQNSPKGIPDALTISEPFLDSNRAVTLILGDNFFHGIGLGESTFEGFHNENVACFGYEVSDPSQYGIMMFDEFANLEKIIEKPIKHISNIAATGLYKLPSDSFKRVLDLELSPRGELEITDLINSYIVEKRVQYKILPRGTAWLDSGTPEGLLGAANFVHTLQERQGLLIGSPHESAWRKGLISNDQLQDYANLNIHTEYGKKLKLLTQGLN